MSSISRNSTLRPAARACVALLLCAFIGSATARADTGFDIGDDAPDFSLLDQHNLTRTLWGNYIAPDRLTLVELTSMWCGPSVLSAQQADSIVQQLQLEGIRLNYLQLMMEDVNFNVADVADAQAWSSNTGNPHPILTGPDTFSQYAGYATAMNSNAVPLFAYIGPDGVIFNQHEGYDPNHVYRTIYAWDSAIYGTPEVASSGVARWQIGSSQGSGDILIDGAASLSGDLSLVNPHASWQLTGADTSLRLEEWKLAFADFDEELTATLALPEDLEMRFEIDDLFWIDEVGGPDPGRDYDHVLVNLEGVIRLWDENDFVVGSEVIDLWFDGNRLTTESVVLADIFDFPHSPETANVHYIEIDGITIKANAIAVPEPGPLAALGGAALLLLRRRSGLEPRAVGDV